MKLTYLSYLIFPLLTSAAFAAETTNQYSDLESYFRLQIAPTAKSLVSEVRVLRSIKFKTQDGKNLPLNLGERNANEELANQKLARLKELDENIAVNLNLPFGTWQQFTHGDPMPELMARNIAHPIYQALELHLFRFAIYLLKQGVIMPVISTEKLERYRQHAKDMDRVDDSQRSAEIIHIIEGNLLTNLNDPATLNFYQGATLADLLDDALSSFEDLRRALRQDFEQSVSQAQIDHAKKCEEINQKYLDMAAPLQIEQKKLEEQNVVDTFWSSPRKNLSNQFTLISDKKSSEIKELEEGLVKSTVTLESRYRANLKAKTIERDKEIAELLKHTMDEIMKVIKDDATLSMKPVVENACSLHHPLFALLTGGFVRSAVTLVHYGLQFHNVTQASETLKALNASEYEVSGLLADGSIDTIKICVLAWEKFGYGTQKEASAMVEEIQASSIMWSFACTVFSKFSSLIPSSFLSWWSKPAEELKAPVIAEKTREELAELERLNEQFETNERAQSIFFGPYRSLLNL